MENRVKERAEETQSSLGVDEVTGTVGKREMEDEEIEEVKFDISQCDACGECLDVCPRNALSMYEKGFVIQEDCNQCGMCVEACDREALHFAD